MQSKTDESDPRYEFYKRAIAILNRSGVPFLIGGAFALKHYTGIVRWTKDIDIFIYPEDYERVLEIFSKAGYRTELTFPHWLGKAFSDESLVDIIFSSGNGICKVDDAWFEYATEGEVFNLSVKFGPPEEIVWSKAFIMERERYDGADIVHILHACAKNFDWPRLLDRFGSYWRVLFSHLILFGFIYPAERLLVPNSVTQELLSRLQSEMNTSPPAEQLCQGTLLSLSQYLVDVECWGYEDARLIPTGNMTNEEIAHVKKMFKE